MKIEDIIEELNRYIENKRADEHISVNGHLVLQRTVFPNSTFKAYKSYEIILWFVKDKKKYKVLSLKHTAKVVDGREEGVNKIMDKQFCYLIIDWLNSDSYNEVLMGTFKKEEQ